MNVDVTAKQRISELMHDISTHSIE